MKKRLVKNKMESTVTIRVYNNDWKKLRRIFPSLKGESLAMYLRRYIIELEKQNDRI